MTNRKTAIVKQEILKRYQRRTKKSFELRQRSVNYLPGGDTRSVAFFPPYPFFASKGAGCHIYDVDGNEYIDCVNNMTALIHGHAHPHIVEAISRQALAGTAHAAPTELQYNLAKMICDRVPSVESLRFCNSGTEATLFAIRAARVFTGKDMIIKMDAGYHGSHDYVEVNLLPDFAADDLPTAHVEAGVPTSILNDVRIAPFNNLDAMERILKENQDKVAAIILEPVLAQGGGIVPREGYLSGLRDLADSYKTLLIFDEIITFRASLGGMQVVADINPDLTTLGKIIGGGLPVGAFGGRGDIMQMFDPTKPDAVTHSGTFSGNALTMAAGIAALEILDHNEIDRINRLGNRLRMGLKAAMDSVGIKGQIGGFGSTAFVYFFDQPFENAKEAALAVIPTLEFAQDVHLEMLNQGLYAITRGLVAFAVSTPMNEQKIDQIVDRFGKALEFAGR
jgi:glutamate-1-semialdehyde 2,1-aminomutase